ncbi:MAG: patatin-like phospholipase family protein [Proteobacteria bacterium]|nr:patatin-like phospholipase family protein [Pseudomonadota bacterium]
MSAPDPTFAVAFGGGGARGLAHIHAIEALDELGIRPVAIAGSSIGAIMGAGMAAGMTGRQIRAYAATMLGSPTEVARRVWGSRPGSIREAVAGGFRFGQFDIVRILKSFLPDAVPATFEELKIPLSITGTDYYGHSLMVMEQGDLISAIGASAAIPAVFRPVTREDRLLVDGGIHNPVPFDLLTGKAEFVIAIDVVGAPEEGDKPPSAIDLMFGASQLMMQSIIDAKLAIDQPDIFLRPPVSKFRVLDFMKINQVLAETEALKDELKRAVAAIAEQRV